MKRLALFAHYDRDNRIRPYILHHLKALKDLGASVIFISNSPLPEEELRQIRDCTDDILLHGNIGLDFGMWKAGMAKVSPSEWDELILTNSSIIGPCAPLTHIFERMGEAPCDFWAMTESWVQVYHLQSYFIVFKQKALQSRALRDFFDAVLLYPDKRNVILAYELGLYAYLAHQGLRGLAAFPIAALQVSPVWDLLLFLRSATRIPPRRNKRKRLNPTIDQAPHLFAGGMPYLKVEILRQNPRGIWHAPLQHMVRKHPIVNALSQDL